jgi:hypothetical protein
MSRRVINASALADDPDVADWLFQAAAIDEMADPLIILLQREQDDEDDVVLQFLRTFN